MSKVKLRKLQLRDAPRMLELYASDKLLQNLSVEKKAKDITLKDERKFIGGSLKAYRQAKPKGLSFAITVDGEFIGCIGINKIDYKNMNAEIGYWIGEPYWGKGYTSQAVKQLTELLFKKYKVVRVFAYAYLRNKASQRVLAKAGFKFEGIRRKAVKHHGKFIDDTIYARVR